MLVNLFVVFRGLIVLLVVCGIGTGLWLHEHAARLEAEALATGYENDAATLSRSYADLLGRSVAVSKSNEARMARLNEENALAEGMIKDLQGKLAQANTDLHACLAARTAMEESERNWRKTHPF